MYPVLSLMFGGTKEMFKFCFSRSYNPVRDKDLCASKRQQYKQLRDPKLTAAFLTVEGHHWEAPEEPVEMHWFLGPPQSPDKQADDSDVHKFEHHC